MLRETHFSQPLITDHLGRSKKKKNNEALSVSEDCPVNRDQPFSEDVQLQTGGKSYIMLKKNTYNVGC